MEIRVSCGGEADEMMESKAFVSWDEVMISNEKGRREVHYYLKRSNGDSDLAVVGKEKSLRHMSYVVQSPFLRSLKPSSALKWRSRREVLDWLSSLVTDSHSHESPSLVDRILDEEDALPMDDPSFKDLSSRKLKHQSREFSWIGSSWTCRKRRKHYKSFCRNGIKISVHDFVHVMVEDDKRLVAYLEDLYEDSRANNMVLVRWFHKLDEVGTVLPPNCNDREIFFSLCLQDLNVECIDGFATVLNGQHFEKFLTEATHTTWKPYLCQRQFANEDIKPFDITQVQGYWRQDLLRYMYSSSSINGTGINPEKNGRGDAIRSRLKRKHVLKDGNTNLPHKGHGIETSAIVGNSNGSNVSCKTEGQASTSGNVGSSAGSNSFPRKLVIKCKPQQHLSEGCSVEVLSQDSGIRGCWFRGVILKRRKDKLKIRYQDIEDAEETGNLEEWIPALRIASPDELGMRMHGRPTIRPHPPPKSRFSMVFDVGSAVDAWCSDGWWEGIVVQRESEDKFHVYFPGERRTSVIGCGDLRRSFDWVCNRWNHIKDRLDIVNSILSDQGLKSKDTAAASQVLPLERSAGKPLVHEDIAICKTPCSGPSVGGQMNQEVPNLAQDNSLAHLKWKTSRKRRRSRESSAKISLDRKRQCDGSSSSSQDDDVLACTRFLIPKPLKVDHENCKYGGNPLFSAPPIPTLSSLVLSR